jgi:hypothetical protein
VVYGPDFRVDALGAILREELARALPVSVSPGVEYAVNVRAGRIYVTLINNEGVTKEPRKPAVVDPTKHRTVTVTSPGNLRVRSVKDIKNHQPCRLQDGNRVEITVAAGGLAILEFEVD